MKKQYSPFQKAAIALLDYAHTPEKITAALNVASELAQKLAKENKSSGKIIIIYEPLTNRRQGEYCVLLPKH